jgi:hypothetical protein
MELTDGHSLEQPGVEEFVESLLVATSVRMVAPGVSSRSTVSGVFLERLELRNWQCWNVLPDVLKVNIVSFVKLVF